MDYGEIVRKSWKITKTNRWLWVYGLVISVMGGGMGFQGMRGLGGDWGDKDGKQIYPDTTKELTQVLGQSTDAIIKWFQGVPIWIWVIGGIGIIGAILTAMVIRWVTLAWAKGGLIAGLAAADSTDEKAGYTDGERIARITLASTSRAGLKFIKKLIKFSIISFLMTTLIVMAMGLVSALGMVGFNYLPSPVKEILMVIWGIAIVLTFVVLMFLVATAAIWAERLIVLENYPAGKAWKSGFALSWKHFWSVIMMGAINLALGCGISLLSMLAFLIVLGIPAGLLIWRMFKGGFHAPGMGTIASLGIILLLFIYLNLLVRVLLTVFSYGNWNQYFKLKMQSEKGAKNE